MLLGREPLWVSMPPKKKRTFFLRVLEERVRFFVSLKAWLKQNGGYQSVRSFSPPSPDQNPAEYCLHCGGCCETPSGLADFPMESLLPQPWKDLFGSGLGKGHRFCPFLWEYRNTGLSLCAIHPWRANPCRTFGEEDCRFVLRDPDLPYLTDQERTRRSCSSLLRLLRP